MKFNASDYKDKKVVIHCKTYQEAKEFCKTMNREEQIEWWSNCGEDTCYDVNCEEYDTIEFYLNHGYTILDWSFFSNNFTKSDLRTGDVILRRNGEVEIVILEQKITISKNGYDILLPIKEDLTFPNDPNFDIIAVRRPKDIGDCFFDAFKYKTGYLVYEREEEVEMTLEEICKILGKQVKIITIKRD